MPIKFIGVNIQNTSLPLTNSLVDHFSCTGTLTDTNLLSLVSNTSLSNVASNSNTDGFVLNGQCEIPNLSYINFSCFVKFNYDSTLSSNQSTIIRDDGKASLNIYIQNDKLYAKTTSSWLLVSAGIPIDSTREDNILQFSVNRTSNTISFYYNNTFVGEQTDHSIYEMLFHLANTNIPIKDVVLYNGILSESDRTTVYSSLLGIYPTTLLVDDDIVTTRSTTNSIVGRMEAIISPSNTSDKQVITLPFNVANSVYFEDGKTLQQKFDNGELGGSGSGSGSGSNNKWYGKNIVCLGDSITASGYPTYIGEVLGAFINNQGSSGGTYARDFDIIQNIDWTYVDAVTYMTGQNSAGGGKYNNRR